MGFCLSKELPSKPVPIVADNSQKNPDWIFGRYELSTGKESVLGEGSFSIVTKATDHRSGLEVAVKMYKKPSGGTQKGRPRKSQREVTLKRYNRQVSVLQALAEPMVAPKGNPGLWHPEFSKKRSLDFFLELLDHSKSATTLDLVEEVLYLVTEIADYSLKDLIADNREKGINFTNGQIHHVTYGLTWALAALHAKKLVHLDIKPENFMRVGDHWKVIDVDGCVPVSATVQISDSSISFSPSYCAPEWAEFLVKDEPTISITDKLDVWSLAISLCELVILDAIFKPQYAAYYKKIGNHKRSGFVFLAWLADGDSWKARLPSVLSTEDGDTANKANHDFRDFLSQLLHTKPDKRKSLAAVLDHPFMTKVQTEEAAPNREQIKQSRKRALEPVSEKPPILKGTLFKLNMDSDMKVLDNWLKRDMWLAPNGSLCYFSTKYQKRLVYVDANVLMRAEIVRVKEKAAMEHAFTIRLPNTEHEYIEEYETVYLACETEADLTKWMHTFEKVTRFEYQDIKSIEMTCGILREMHQFQLQVKNRRENLDSDGADFNSVYSSLLWKLNQEGDPLDATHWTQREMWVAKNGSLCYVSLKDSKKLQYFTEDDMGHVEINVVEGAAAFYPYAFKIQLPAADGLEFAPAYFAALSEESRDNWIKNLMLKREEINRGEMLRNIYKPSS